MTGKMIVARIPVLADEMVLIRLHGLEATGIWVESRDFNESILQKHQMAASTTSLILFIPFSGIDFIVSSVLSVSLSERLLGLDD
jgi:hypothetical protein